MAEMSELSKLAVDYLFGDRTVFAGDSELRGVLDQLSDQLRPLEGYDEYLIPTGAHWTCESRPGEDWMIRWNATTKTVQAKPFASIVTGGFSAEASDIAAARREVLRIAGLIADGKTEEN